MDMGLDMGVYLYGISIDKSLGMGTAMGKGSSVGLKWVRIQSIDVTSYSLVSAGRCV